MWHGELRVQVGCTDPAPPHLLAVLPQQLEPSDVLQFRNTPPRCHQCLLLCGHRSYLFCPSVTFSPKDSKLENKAGIPENSQGAAGAVSLETRESIQVKEMICPSGARGGPPAAALSVVRHAPGAGVTPGVGKGPPLGRPAGDQGKGETVCMFIRHQNIATSSRVQLTVESHPFSPASSLFLVSGC